MIALLLACAPEIVSEPLVEMEPARLYTRASLDLRGVRPSQDELDALRADPDGLDAMLDTLVEDERFPERLVQLLHEIYLTETEGMDLRSDNLEMDNPRAFYWEVGQEPLRLVAEVARLDLPYTDVVLADWTMATDQMATWFPIELEPGDALWRRARYADGRPAGGVISTNGLWWRYTSTESNANRRRANALTRILVCQDHLDRPIAFDQGVNLLDEDAIRDAIHHNPSCVNCHVTLDPVAANLFGFYWTNFTSPTEGATYHAGKERLWRELLDTEPGWYGEPTGGLVDLGRAIAADPRLPSCAAQQAFERMVRRDATEADTEALAALRDRFVGGGLHLKELYRAVVDLPAYRAADLPSETGVPSKLMTPDVLGSSVEALTGFTYLRDGTPVLTTDRYGLRGLGGGVTGSLVTRPAGAPSSTILLVQTAVADEASSYAVAMESAMDPADRTLFTEVDFSETAETDPGAILAQLRVLHLRVLGQDVAVEDPRLEDELELWEGLYAVEGSPARAWQGMLQALLRDPDYLLY